MLVATPALLSVVRADGLLEVTDTNWLAPKPVEVKITDLLSDERVACTPVESLNWLTDATTAELLVALVKESCTVPTLPAIEIVAEPVRPVLEPAKLNWPVCAEAMTETETAREALPTLAELIETEVNAEVVDKPEVL